MALVFDGTGRVEFTEISLASDFSITLPSVKITNSGVQVLMGTQSTTDIFVAYFDTGRVDFQIKSGNTASVTTGGFSVGDTLPTITISRTGSAVTLDVGGTTNTITEATSLSLGIWGARAGPSTLETTAEYTGIGTISGTGLTTIQHDFDTSTGTTLNDNGAGNNTGTLIGFTTGGFVATPVDAVFVTSPAQNRILPRTSTTGGLFSKGQASLTFNATGTGNLTYRLVDEDEITTITSFTPFTTGVDFSVNIPANAQWYKLEIVSDTDNVSVFSERFSCGGVTLITGQSLAVRMFNAIGDATTLAALSITPSSFHSTYAQLVDTGLSGGPVSKAWRQVADGSDIDSAFVADFTNRKITEEGVSWALIGYSEGSSAISNFTPPSSTGYTANLAIINDVGGFNELIWFQGHSDSTTLYQTYRDSLQSIYDQFLIDNPLSFSVDTLAITNKNSASFGSVEQNAKIRRAHKDFNDSNGGSFVNAFDIELVGDGIHQSQLGNVSLTRNVFRTQYSSSVGASFSGFTRTGANINVTFDLKPDSTTLVGVGNPIGVVSVSLVSDPYTFLTNTSVTVNTDNINITLSADPLTDDLLIWFGSSQNNNGATSIRDNYTADGFTVGRNVNRTIAYFGGEMVYNEPLFVDLTIPVITVSGSAVTEVQGNTAAPTFTATAFDALDGDITGSIVVAGDTVNTAVLGSYVITYNVTDANGNAAPEVTRTVNVVDTLSPFITVSGSATTIVDINGVAPTFTATATDGFYGDITGSIVATGDTIDTSTLGTYTRFWDVTDASGNAATQQTRTVLVRDPTAGVPVEFRGNSILFYGYLDSLGFTGTVGDMTKAWLSSEGFVGNVNDSFSAYLSAQGYTGTINDKNSKWKNE